MTKIYLSKKYRSERLRNRTNTVKSGGSSSISSGGGSGGITEITWDSIRNKPETFTPSAHTHTFSDITDNIDAGTF